jgi:hypothetical protein
MAVYFSALNMGDTVMALDLAHAAGTLPTATRQISLENISISSPIW